MADRVSKVNYCYTKVSARAGQGARVLKALRDANVNLWAFSGFPSTGGKAQLDFVAGSMSGIRRVAARNGWKLSPVKKAFLITGGDTPGAVHRHVQKLADRSISIIAADGVCAGAGRYGMILWVKPADYARAAKALGAK